MWKPHANAFGSSLGPTELKSLTEVKLSVLLTLPVLPNLEEVGLSGIGQFILLSQLGAAVRELTTSIDYPRVGPGSRLRSVSGASPCAEYTSAGASRSVVRLVKLLSVSKIPWQRFNFI